MTAHLVYMALVLLVVLVAVICFSLPDTGPSPAPTPAAEVPKVAHPAPAPLNTFEIWEAEHRDWVSKSFCAHCSKRLAHAFAVCTGLSCRLLDIHQTADLERRFE